MSIIQGNAHTSAGGGGFNIERSLRFNSADSAYLNRTFGTPTNNLKWTMSMWVKRGEITIPHMLFCAPLATSSNFAIWFSASGSSSNGDFINYHIPNVGSRPFITNAVYRDTSAWYHFVFVFDSANATQADRFILYVNNARQTASTASVALNQACAFNQSGVVGAIGGSTGGFYGTKSDYFDGYMTEINFIDGQALTPSDFGETDSATGVWKPKAYSSTYGTNGFYLNFSDNSGTTSTTLGKDSSGNGNNWTPNNFSVTAGAGNDSLVDSPTPYGTDTGVGGEVRGNYATLNPLDVSATQLTLSDGNLIATQPSTGTSRTASSTFRVTTGKWYFEGTTTVTSGSSGSIGIANDANASTTYGIYRRGGGTAGLSGNPTFATYTNGDVIGVAFDADARTVSFYKNGTLQGTGNYTWTGTDSVGSRVVVDSLDSTGAWQMNFGQRAFAYTAPSGFKALCTTNLPTPTIGATSTTLANKYFDVKTYLANASTQTITGIGFQPDMFWGKRRDASATHNIVDAVRGVTKYLYSNLTDAEGTWTDKVTAFTSDGFSLGADTTGTGQVNFVNNATQVAWLWNAGGSNATNTSGTITSTVRANTTSGFSIVTYTGNGTAGATVGHGLGVAPSMVITKGRDSVVGATNWKVYHSSLGNTKNLNLNLTNAEATSSTVWNNTTPTSTVFSLGSNGDLNGSTATYVAYCFAPVAGYSAFGSYTGNGSSDGPMIFTGFRPRYVMVKRTDASGNEWEIRDTARDSYNSGTSARLWASSSASELNDFPADILSNGFKPRSTGTNSNGSGATYIYMAFAESPFKYSLAR